MGSSERGHPMPFDGVEQQYDARQQILRRLGRQTDRVIDLLATEDRWCKGELETPDGRYCILGAMHAAQADRILELVVLNAVREVTGRYCWGIARFNDRRSTSHALVLRVLGRARDNLRAGIPFGAPTRGPRLPASLGRLSGTLAGWLRPAPGGQPAAG